MTLEKSSLPDSLSKTIRFPEPLYNYVDSLPGRTFSSKLLGLIRDDMNGCSDRRNDLDEINGLILHSKLLFQTSIDLLRDQISSLNNEIDHMEITVSQWLQDPEDDFVPPEINDELPFH